MANDNEALKKLSRMLDDLSERRKQERAQNDRNQKEFLEKMGKNLAEVLAPALQEMARQSLAVKDELKEALAGLRLDIPPIEIPDIHVPEAVIKVNVPDIHVPPVEIPEIHVPPAVINMPDEMTVKMPGVNFRNPLPVILTGADGKPYVAGSMTLAGGGGGAAFRNVIGLIRGMESSSGVSLVNPDGQLRVAVSQSGGGTQFADGDARGTATGNLGMVDDGTNIQSRLGSSYGVALTQIAGFDGTLVTVTTGALDNNVKYLDGNSPALNAGVTNAGTLRVVQAVDSVTSVNVVSGSASGTQYNDGATPDQAGGVGTVAMLFDGGSAQSWSGSSYGIGQVQLTGFDGSLLGITSNALDGNVKFLDGNAPALNNGVASAGTLRVTQAVDVATSTNVIQLAGTAIDTNTGTVSAGSQRMVIASNTTTMVVGNINSGAADDETPPVKTGGVARTANPTAVSAGSRVSAGYDKIGRQLMRPVQVRDLMTTARVALTTGTEATLLAGVASTFHDLVWITASNNSTASVTVDIRDATAAGIVLTLDVPANGVVGVAGPVPFPQNAAADTWTADMPDITGTTVAISALFSKEV